MYIQSRSRPCTSVYNPQIPPDLSDENEMCKELNPEITHVICVYRVSTGKQEKSGLGLEAQREYCATAIERAGWELVEEITEEAVSGSVEPAQRPGMGRAIAMAKKMNAEAVAAGKAPYVAVLCAKVDRVSRKVAHFAALMDAVPLKVATMPDADNFQLHLFAALAEQERSFIKSRTRDALAALQARADAGDPEAIEKIARRNANIRKAHATTRNIDGVTVPAQAIAGGVNADKADEFAKRMKGELFIAIHAEKCKTLQAIADYLNAQNIPTNGTRGDKKWTARAVRNVMNRLGMQEKGFKQQKRQSRTPVFMP